MLGTVIAGVLTTSGTDTCTGSGGADGAGKAVLAAGGTDGGGSLRTGVEGACPAGAVAAGEAIRPMGEEGRAACRGSWTAGAGAGFVAVTGFGAAGAFVMWRWTTGATASVATVAPTAASLTGAAPPLKNQRQSSAMDAIAPRRDGFVPIRPSSAATERRARKISVSTAATDTPSSTLISSYDRP